MLYNASRLLLDIQLSRKEAVMTRWRNAICGHCNKKTNSDIVRCGKCGIAGCYDCVGSPSGVYPNGMGKCKLCGKQGVGRVQ